MDYFQEAKPSKTYNVMDNFRDAKFSGIDNKILTFPMDSYPVRDMISMIFQRKWNQEFTFVKVTKKYMIS